MTALRPLPPEAFKQDKKRPFLTNFQKQYKENYRNKLVKEAILAQEKNYSLKLFQEIRALLEIEHYKEIEDVREFGWSLRFTLIKGEHPISKEWTHRILFAQGKITLYDQYRGGIKISAWRKKETLLEEISAIKKA